MTAWIPELISRGGYGVLTLMMFLETIFPPVPSEVIMPFAGVEAARGHLSLIGVTVAGACGAMLGNIAWYALARAYGRSSFERQVRRHGRLLTLRWDDIERGKAEFQRRGALYVCCARMIPFLRSVVSIPAGLLEMPLRPFLVWSMIGTFGWTAMLTGAGYLLGRHYTAVDRVISPVATAAIIVAAVAYVVRLATWRAE